MNISMEKLTQLTDQKRTKVVLLLLSALLVFGAGWFSLYWYRIQQGQKAQKMLGDCIEEYMKAQGEDGLWPDVQMMSELARSQNSGTAIAPFFLVIQAQSLAQQGQTTEAIALIDSALSELKEDSPYHSWYKQTKGLMLLDASDVALQQEGVDLLSKLADDQQNIFRDSALFHLGEWFAHQDDVVQAEHYWQQLAQHGQEFVGSPWVEQAQQAQAAL